jgi:hypothetical protein
MGYREVSADDGRDESENERLDRNWHEILQELRVIQTGTQILTGFLLTLAFQQRFTDLDTYQVNTYLGLVIFAALTTVLGLTPVSLHRALFRKRAKSTIVAIANRILKLTLVLVGITLVGTVMLVFDVVVGRSAGLIAGVATLAVVALVWLALPFAAARGIERD